MENYRYFTTEDDIKCPIARELKTAYARINVIRMDERPKHRRGIYRQQRAELINTVTDENDGRPNLVDAISAQVKIRQCELWQAVGEEFIAGALEHFEEFVQALAELLENETYMLEAHRLIRKQLAQQLVGFSKDLRSVMDQFTESDSQRAAKRARTVKIKQESEMLSD
jgi:chromatin segregation and condensation protein Rec8/ScpA/Scc1 (kleisin family)